MEATEEWIWLECRILSADSSDCRKRRRTQKTIERYKTGGTEIGSSGGAALDEVDKLRRRLEDKNLYLRQEIRQDSMGDELA
jgi:hypothetical protein